jgi:hypothetical protein
MYIVRGRLSENISSRVKQSTSEVSTGCLSERGFQLRTVPLCGLSPFCRKVEGHRTNFPNIKYKRSTDTRSYYTRSKFAKVKSDRRIYTRSKVVKLRSDKAGSSWSKHRRLRPVNQSVINRRPNGETGGTFTLVLPSVYDKGKVLLGAQRKGSTYQCVLCVIKLRVVSF